MGLAEANPFCDFEQRPCAAKEVREDRARIIEQHSADEFGEGICQDP